MEYEEIVQRAKEIAGRPIRLPPPHRLELILAEIRGRTERSAALARQIQRRVPRGSQHTLPLSMPYPLFMDKGDGSHLLDVDGNEYVDCILSGGAILLGHNHPGLNGAILEQIQGRTNFHGHFDELEILAADKLIQHFPAVDRVRFTSSGAEADMAAIRVARSYTGKKKIIKFKGAYHGWGDAFMTDMEIPGSGRYIAHGVPGEVLDLTVLADTTDPEALEPLFAAHEGDGGVAAVICEPLGAESGLVPFPPGFHQRALEIAHAHGALYIFDEVVTGLRTGLGGAQALLGVEPDLTTFGKALMNGYPSCGALGGRAEVMETLSTGLPGAGPYAYLAGTLSGNTLSVAAAYHTLRELEQPGVLDHLFQVTGDLVGRLNRLFQAHGVPFFAYHFGGILRIELTAPHAVPITGPDSIGEIIRRRQVLSQYACVLQHAGVLSRMGRDMVCCAHSREDNARVEGAWAHLLDVLGG